MNDWGVGLTYCMKSLKSHFLNRLSIAFISRFLCCWSSRSKIIYGYQWLIIIYKPWVQIAEEMCCFEVNLFYRGSVLHLPCYIMLYNFHSFRVERFWHVRLPIEVICLLQELLGVRMTCLCSSPTSVEVVLPDQQCLVLFSCKNQ